MTALNPVKQLPTGHFHFLVVVRFMFSKPVIQKMEGGEQFSPQGACISYRITAKSLTDAASMLESYLASHEPDLVKGDAAYPDGFEMQVESIDNLRDEYRLPGVVSESGAFYFEDTDDEQSS